LIGHILHRNRLMIHIIEGNFQGRIEMTVRRGRRRKHLLNDHIEGRGYFKIESGSTRSHSAESCLWKSLGTCPKKNCEMNE